MSTRLRRLRTAGALAVGVLAAVLLVRACADRSDDSGEAVQRPQPQGEEPILRGAATASVDAAPPANAEVGPVVSSAEPAAEPAPRRTIRGRVIDDDGQAVPDVPVVEWTTGRSVPPSTSHRRAVTDADGRFEIQVAAGRAWIIPRPRPPWTSSCMAYLPEGIHEVVLRVRRTVPVYGVVLGPAGQPVEGVSVRADTKHRTTFAVSQPTGSDGRFLLHLPLHVPRPMLWCEAPGIFYGDDRHVWIAEAWIDLPHPDEVVLRFVEGVSIEGEVVDHRGQLVVAGGVSVRPADDERPSRVMGGLQWNEGRFRVSRLAPGPYWVSFERFFLGQTAPDPIRVEAPARGVRIRCPEPLRSLSGRVVGEGAHDFVVTISRSVAGAPGDRRVQEMRAQAGAFEFHRRTGADAVLHAYRPGDDRYALLRTEDVAADAYTLVLVEGHRIEGRLLPPVGGFGTDPPKLGVEAPFYRRAEPVQRDGTFVIHGLPRGSWQLYVLHPRYRGRVPLGDPVAAGSTGVMLQYPE